MRAVLLLFLVVGCDPQIARDQWPGENLVPLFPTDGHYTWTFESESEPEYQILGERSASPTDPDSQPPIWTVTYTKQCLYGGTRCDDGPYRTLRMSARSFDGALLHSITTRSRDPVEFEPPVTLAHDDADVGYTVWTTETDIGTVTSTYVRKEPCDIPWTDAWDECTVLSLDDGAANIGFRGEIWLKASWGIVAFKFEDDDARWELTEGTIE